MADRRPLVLGANGATTEVLAGDYVRADGMRSKRFIGDIVALAAVSGTVTPDAASGSTFRHAATTDVTLAKPTNGTDGQAISVVVQASGAARTLTVSGAGAVTIPAGQFYVADLRYDAGTDQWLLNDVAGQITGATAVSSVNGRTGAVSGVAEASDVAARAVALTATAVRSAAYAAGANEFVPASVSAGSWTLTLPTSPADRTRVAAKVVAISGSYVLTIAAGTGAAFNIAGGPTSLTLSVLNMAVIAQYDATSSLWYVQSVDVPLSQLDARFAALAHTHGVDTLTATGTKDATTFLRGDNTWAAPTGGSGGGGGSSSGAALQFPTPAVNDWVMQPASTTSTLTRPNGELQCGYMFLPGGTYDGVAFQVDSAGSAGALLKVVIYSDVNNRPGALLVDSATISATSNGIKTITGLALVIPAGGGGIWAGTVGQGGASTQPAIWGVSRTGSTTVFANTAYPMLFYANTSPTWMATGVTGAAPPVSGMTSNRGDSHSRLAFRRSA